MASNKRQWIVIQLIPANANANCIVPIFSYLDNPKDTVRRHREMAVTHRDITDIIHHKLSLVERYFRVAGIQTEAEIKKNAARTAKVCCPKNDDLFAASEIAIE